MADRARNVEQRLMLENSGCWATQDEESIHVFAKDGSELYALSSKVIPFDSKALFLTLQIYMIGHNNGRAGAQQESKAKLQQFAELLKLCV
jgi:hypothetical protein